MATERHPPHRIETDAIRRRHTSGGHTIQRPVVHMVLHRYSARDLMLSQILTGATESARQHNLDLVPVAGGLADRSGPSAGLLLFGAMTAAHVTDALATGLPVVRIGHGSSTEVTAVSVANDHAGGATAAVTHLREAGHRRIALACGNDTMRHWRERRAAWRTVLTRAGLAADLDCLLTKTDPTSACEAFLAAWAAGMHATAVFAANDTIALGIYAAAAKLGLRIPTDLSVVGFDDIDDAAHMIPPLTTIQVAKQALGSAAVEALVRLMAGETVDDRNLPTRLIRRASVASPRQI